LRVWSSLDAKRHAKFQPKIKFCAVLNWKMIQFSESARFAWIWELSPTSIKKIKAFFEIQLKISPVSVDGFSCEIAFWKRHFPYQFWFQRWNLLKIGRVKMGFSEWLWWFKFFVGTPIIFSGKLVYMWGAANLTDFDKIITFALSKTKLLESEPLSWIRNNF
jgi:hypothetical protein